MSTIKGYYGRIDVIRTALSHNKWTQGLFTNEDLMGAKISVAGFERKTMAVPY